MSRYLKVALDGLVWGFSMAIGWIVALALVGVAAA